MKDKLFAGFIVLGVAVFLLLVSVFQVREGRSALLLRVGKLVTRDGVVYVAKPGLHFKWPFVEKVRLFNMRLRSFEQEPESILTAEQKYMLVDYVVKWRISDVALYYKRTGNRVGRTKALLQQKINNAMRALFGRRTITEVVSGQRGDIMAILRRQVNARAKRLGMTIIDFRIKRIDLPVDVRSSVFQRMRTQREQVAAKLRADGNAKSMAIRAGADAKVVVTLAQARAEAAKIRADGRAEATKIYRLSYQRDPDFYRLFRSLMIYSDTFSGSNNVLLLSPKGALLHPLRHALQEN